MEKKVKVSCLRRLFDWFKKRKTLVCLFQSFLFFKFSDIKDIYNKLSSESKTHFWSTFSSHLVALFTAWMGFSIGYLIYDSSKKESEKLTHYGIVSQIKPYYDEYNDSCGTISNYFMSLFQKNISDPHFSEHMVESLIKSDSIKYLSDTTNIKNVIKMGNATVKIINDAKLYLSRDEKDINQIEAFNIQIKLGIDLIKVMMTNDDHILESATYKEQLSPFSLIGLVYNNVDFTRKIDSLALHYKSLYSYRAKQKMAIDSMQACIDTLNAIIGIREEPINENSIIMNDSPGNELSDRFYKNKVILKEEIVRFSQISNQIDSIRSHVMIEYILLPSIRNRLYIDNAIAFQKHYNPIAVAGLIFLLSLLLSYILFRFLILRFFKYLD